MVISQRSEKKRSDVASAVPATTPTTDYHIAPSTFFFSTTQPKMLDNFI